MNKRPLRKILRIFFQKPFYIAFINIFKYFEHPVEVLRRYVFGKGGYPKKLSVKTPLGKHEVCLYSFHDTITLVECFGKLDYQAEKNISCVVDFGSNIGVSAGYFLTRNKNIKVYLFEPLPENIGRLKTNLKGFEKRYKLREVAVGLENGSADFGFETTGRYGGLGSDLPQSIQVQVRKADEVITDILEKEGHIDILKIDVEGLETAIIESLSLENLKKIDRIYAETIYTKNLPGFEKEQYGEVVRFRKVSSLICPDGEQI
ncbi:MAG: FkbM family methyltransferase [Nitrospinae bacterium]|nr:FkbM family methyltransferase [Nitrospinota bacterium]